MNYTHDHIVKLTVIHWELAIGDFLLLLFFHSSIDLDWSHFQCGNILFNNRSLGSHTASHHNMIPGKRKHPKKRTINLQNTRDVVTFFFRGFVVIWLPGNCLFFLVGFCFLPLPFLVLLFGKVFKYY